MVVLVVLTFGLGEEEGVSGTGSGLMWALDPIDGTANFLHGVPLCAVSLGLLDQDRAVLGVIDLPMLGTRYAAFQGGGAWENDRPIHASATNRLGDAVVAIGDYAVGDGSDGKNARRLAITSELSARALRVRMFGSAAIDLVWLASGRIDATVMLSNNPWDTAAGTIIAREAGAVVMDDDGTDHTVGARATVGATQGIRQELLELLASTDS